jgi:hypothetical protein
MATLFVGSKFSATDAAGAPLSGGKVYTYAAGTLTPLATYTDQGGLSSNANPVVLDSQGRANIWLGLNSYKFVVTDADGVAAPDGTVDNISAPPSSADLASTSTAAKGAGMVGYDVATAYAAGSVGAILRRTPWLEDYASLVDVDDWTDALTAAIAAVNTAGGGILNVGAGRFKVDGDPVTLLSNVRVVGRGDATVFYRSASGPSTFIFNGLGTYDGTTEYAISAALDQGDVDVTFTGAHTFTAGEAVWIVGQRNSLDEHVATADWALGYATPTAGACFFGEFNEVQSVTSSTEIKLSQGVVFPNYKADRKLEGWTAGTVTTADDTIAITGHPFASNDLVWYYKTATTIGGLTDATSYYVIKVDADTIKLSLTSGGSAINLTSTGDGVIVMDSTSRASTTVRKVTWIENASLESCVVEMERSVTFAVRFDYARNCGIRGVTFKSFLNNAASASFQRSVDCYGEDCKAIHTPRDYLDSEQVSNIDFKSISSQRIRWLRCSSSNGTQAFDFTYLTDCTPNLFGKMADCDVHGARVSGMTTHPGAYAVEVTNNKFIGVRQAINMRSRNSIVTGNTGSYIGSLPASVSSLLSDYRTHYGIGLYEGWARDCEISGNQMIGFPVGIGINDAADVGECFSYVGANIHGNTLTGCFFGFYRDTNTAKLSTDHTGICFVDNRLIRCSRPIFIEPYTVGVKLHDNLVYGMALTSDTAILFGLNCPHQDIQFNSIVNIGATNTGINSGNVSGTFSYSVLQTNVIRNNRFFGSLSAKYSVNGTYVDSRGTGENSLRDGALVLIDGVTAPASLTGFATLYIDSADGDLKIIYADGTTKTIAADT